MIIRIPFYCEDIWILLIEIGIINNWYITIYFNWSLIIEHYIYFTFCINVFYWIYIWKKCIFIKEYLEDKSDIRLKKNWYWNFLKSKIKKTK